MLVTGLVRAQEFGSGPTEGFGQQVSVGQGLSYRRLFWGYKKKDNHKPLISLWNTCYFSRPFECSINFCQCREEPLIHCLTLQYLAAIPHPCSNWGCPAAVAPDTAHSLLSQWAPGPSPPVFVEQEGNAGPSARCCSDTKNWGLVQSRKLSTL